MLFIAGAVTAGMIILGTQYFAKAQRSLSTDQHKSVMRIFVKNELRQFVQQIEYYHLVNAKYPMSLKELNKKNIGLAIDPFTRSANCTQEYFYFVESDNSGYFLRSIGPDHKVFTADDIVPQVEKQAIRKIGLRNIWNSTTSHPKAKCYEWD
ncbi:MAG: hypothetical protein JAZ12_02570 [Candidatus Thiodiazotropha taylori]|nr:hypothetical protein [Candidatus Thiodiazotropha taylori]